MIVQNALKSEVTILQSIAYTSPSQTSAWPESSGTAYTGGSQKHNKSARLPVKQLSQIVSNVKNTACNFIVQGLELVAVGFVPPYKWGLLFYNMCVYLISNLN